MGLSYGNGGSDLYVLFLYVILEQPRGQMSKGVHGNNLFGITPLWKGANVHRGFGIGEVGPMVDVKILARHSERMVDGVGASMGADGYIRQFLNRKSKDSTATYHYGDGWCSYAWTQRRGLLQQDRYGPIPWGGDRCRLDGDTRLR